MHFAKVSARFKEAVKTRCHPELIAFLRKFKLCLSRGEKLGWTILSKFLMNHINLWRYAKKSIRYLEIGSGNIRLPGFETLDIIGGRNVDYVYDASKPLPFEDNTFDLIYASHVLEHIPWYKTEEVLKEWVRILKPGGILEVWIPDGLKICKALVQAELEGIKIADIDNWCKFNPRKDPCVWASGRIFWGANHKYPSWHKALFTPRYLKELFEHAGLVDIRELDPSEVRGYDHGWINLGIGGRKP